MNATVKRKPEGTLPALAFSLGVRLLLSAYWLVRFGGNWVEGDSARTTLTIRSVLETGQLIPVDRQIYTHGFLYSVYVSMTSLLSGVSILELQKWILPLTGVLLTIVAFAFYQRIFKSPMTTALAVTFLNLQGDFLFTSSRGSHEKLDFALIFVSLLIIALSVAWFDSMKERLGLAIMYYLTILAENTANVFFASTFTISLLVAFLFWVILAKLSRRPTSGPSWLIYVALMSMIFTFAVIFFWYPPASNVLITARDLTERLRLILFSAAEPPAEIFTTVSGLWIFPYAWLILRLFDIMLIIAAGVAWISLVRQVFRKRAASDSPLGNDFLWLLILMPPFAIQNAAVILSDITGSATDINNLQIRLIPLTIFIAAPLAAYSLVRLVVHLRARRLPAFLGFLAALTLVLLILSMTLIKGVSEPVVSNAWFFYSPPESAAMAWLDRTIPFIPLKVGLRLPRVWAGPDFRLGYVWQETYWGTARVRIPVASEDFTYVLISPVVRALAFRYHQPIPDILEASRLYDNGDVQIYYLRPEAR